MFEADTAIAWIKSESDLTNNPLAMHLTMTHTKLNFNLKADFQEQNIFLTATTRGDNTIHKPIFVGIKKACAFNLAT